MGCIISTKPESSYLGVFSSVFYRASMSSKSSSIIILNLFYSTNHQHNVTFSPRTSDVKFH
jgi:hypothetical protein